MKKLVSLVLAAIILCASLWGVAAPAKADVNSFSAWLSNWDPGGEGNVWKNLRGDAVGLYWGLGYGTDSELDPAKQECETGVGAWMSGNCPRTEEGVLVVFAYCQF